MESLFNFIISIIDLFKFTVVVEPWEGALRTRLGTGKKILKPGFHFIFPFKIDNVTALDVVTTIEDTTVQTVKSLDSIPVSVEAAIRFKILNVELAICEVQDLQETLINASMGAIADCIGEKTFAECTVAGLKESVLTAIRNEVSGWGIKIQKFQIITLCESANYRMMGESSTGIISSNDED